MAVADGRTLQHVGNENLLLRLWTAVLRNFLVPSHRRARQDKRTRIYVSTLTLGGSIQDGAPRDCI
jgi:hypothetical protein